LDILTRPVSASTSGESEQYFLDSFAITEEVLAGQKPWQLISFTGLFHKDTILQKKLLGR